MGKIILTGDRPTGRLHVEWSCRILDSMIRPLS